MDRIRIVTHPLLQHKLSLIRDKSCPTELFRATIKEIGLLLCYEVMRDWPLETYEIYTPLVKLKTQKLIARRLVYAPILRAGMTFVEGMLELMPSALIAHIGLHHDKATGEVHQYLFKAPTGLKSSTVIVADPIVRTGKTAVTAINELKRREADEIRFVCIIGTPDGLDMIRDNHPDVSIWTMAIDNPVQKNWFVVPGLGDASDRAYGTE
jgi:uracil phosphoribosyltransferase